ncbi:MarR family transcriptional regulator [Corynebacterium lowii]|uniref:MarR family protein n=1 Tax=Corynebacterium lowii TaxID=1544413 RepID=A0A0Q0UL47_9CORY|nr:helix-turn-helix domain-containing protein [Corynebacterium lowii]KQB87044.1 MarR family protein [Corynebacterium lowii]MDP9852374.1 putative NBD/HSP70 family sugar kinase [Corynebacterium lowii]
MSTPAASADPGLRFTLPSTPVARVFHQIRTLPKATRSHLRDTLGYSQSSVTRHVLTLMEAGLVEEGSARHEESHTGRPGSTLLLDGRHLILWGVHVGVRSTVLVISDGAGRILRERTLALVMPEHDAEESLHRIAQALKNLSSGLPAPTGVGAIFSTHIDEYGVITSDIYGWRDVPAAALLSEYLGHPLRTATGVTAMAATELLSHPLSEQDSPAHQGATLYFYARDVVAHSWLFHGAVHRPAQGRSPFGYLGQHTPHGTTSSTTAFPSPELTGLPHIHPLGNTSVLYSAHSHGIAARDFEHLVHLSQRDPLAREILDSKARLLAKVLRVAVDVVDPDSLVLAGETFTLDPDGLHLIAETLSDPGRSPQPHQLRIQRANKDILRSAARLVSLYELWTNPLGALS